MINRLIGDLLVIKPKNSLSGLQDGLHGILYDHEINHLIVCDAWNGKIIKLDPTTGIISHLIVLWN